VGHQDLVSSVAFSPDGTTLASASRDGTVRLWDIASNHQVGEPLRGHRGSVERVLFVSGTTSPNGTSLFDGSLLASAGYDGNVVIWRLKGSGDLVRQLSLDKATANVISFGVNGRFVAVAGERTIQLFNPDSGDKVGAAIDLRDSVVALAASADGRFLASATLHGTIQIWDASNQIQIDRSLTGDDPLIHALAFSPDTQRLAAAGQDGLMVWDLSSRKAVHEILQDHTGDVYCVAYSPDGRFLASGGRDGTIVLHNAATLEALGQPLQGHAQGVTRLVFEGSSKLLVSGSFDGTVRVWQVSEHWAKEETSLRLAGAAINTVAISPDGGTIAAGADDGTITLWDLAERQVIGGPLRSHRSGVTSLSFSPDGRFSGSAAGDGAAVLWMIDLREWEGIAEHLVQRDLTPEEWRRFIGSSVPYRPTFMSLRKK
jgi:WD40 repeat protein